MAYKVVITPEAEEELDRFIYSHNYFLLYRIDEDTVIVDAIFHALQDYENNMKYRWRFYQPSLLVWG